MQNKHAQGHVDHWHSDLTREQINKRKQAHGTKQERNKGVSTPYNDISDLSLASLGFLVWSVCGVCTTNLIYALQCSTFFTPPEFLVLMFTGVSVCVCVREITTFHNKTLFIL